SASSSIAGSTSLKNRFGTGVARAPSGKPPRPAVLSGSVTPCTPSSRCSGLITQVQVFELGRAAVEAQIHLAGRAVAVLGDNDRGDAGGVRAAGLVGMSILPVVFAHVGIFPIDEHHHVGVLL